MQVEMPRGPLRVGNLPGGKIRAADVTDFAGANEIIEGAKGLLDRCGGIGEMNLVEIDPVGAEALEAGLGGGDDVMAGGALHGSGLVHGAAEFGGQDDALAVLAEDLAEDGFRTAALAVGIRGIEKGDAQVDGLVNDFAGSLQIDAQAEVIAAEAYDGDVRSGVTEFAQLHCKISQGRTDARRSEVWHRKCAPRVPPPFL